MQTRRGFRATSAAARQDGAKLVRIAIIGAGKVGTTLGRGWTRHRHQVTYGVRDPEGERAVALAQEGVGVALPAAAVARSEVVVLATPWAGAKAAVEALGDLGGRPLLDATNPIGPGLTLAVGRAAPGASWCRRGRRPPAW